MQSHLKHEIKTQINDSQQNVRNLKINSGVIFIDESKNSRGNNINSTYAKGEGKTYWFHKYLQDLQKRGISQKIGKNY
ncbi:hypothetical protein LCGC14_0915880 [marine sediment metagenome]|uniref:Uncharacterized protein n=1 Tax=marine sediment metagenome TaxID=412755 RepID=A0A0F9RB20_9ZZZZ|nr:hypothetical protein [bacterium]